MGFMQHSHMPASLRRPLTAALNVGGGRRGGAWSALGASSGGSVRFGLSGAAASAAGELFASREGRHQAAMAVAAAAAAAAAEKGSVSGEAAEVGAGLPGAAAAQARRAVWPPWAAAASMERGEAPAVAAAFALGGRTGSVEAPF